MKFVLPIEGERFERKQNISACCQDFEYHINNKCEQHGFDCPDNIVRFYTDFRGEPGFGLRLPDESYYVIHHCPWCGVALKPIAADAVEKSKTAA